VNTLGVSPRDLIALVQALRASGSLQADLEIL
jgi:flagellar basal body P-ring protein FlgI